MFEDFRKNIALAACGFYLREPGAIGEWQYWFYVWRRYEYGY